MGNFVGLCFGHTKIPKICALTLAFSAFFSLFIFFYFLHLVFLESSSFSSLWIPVFYTACVSYCCRYASLLFPRQDPLQSVSSTGKPFFFLCLPAQVGITAFLHDDYKPRSKPRLPSKSLRINKSTELRKRPSLTASPIFFFARLITS